MFFCVCSYVFTVYDCSNCTHVDQCKGFRKRSYEPGSPCSVFSCFLFSTVFLHFTEQIKWWWWWWLTDTDLCPCGETQMMSHIVESCPLTKLNGGSSRLHSADEYAVSWLTSYGSWHAYEKKILHAATLRISCGSMIEAVVSYLVNLN